MGQVVGEKFVQAANVALAERIPLVCFSASGGARMQEAILSLMQMSKTAAVLERMKQEGIPYISVMTDLCLVACPRVWRCWVISISPSQTR